MSPKVKCHQNWNLANFFLRTLLHLNGVFFLFEKYRLVEKIIPKIAVGWIYPIHICYINWFKKSYYNTGLSIKTRPFWSKLIRHWKEEGSLTIKQYIIWHCFYLDLCQESFYVSIYCLQKCLSYLLDKGFKKS